MIAAGLRRTTLVALAIAILGKWQTAPRLAAPALPARVGGSSSLSNSAQKDARGWETYLKARLPLVRSAASPSISSYQSSGPTTGTARRLGMT